MDENKFRKWLSESGKSKKVISDTISRIKRVEKELGNIDIDKEFEKDQCEKLLKLFKNTGRNEDMCKLKTNLPIGKYSLNVYRYAIHLYMAFKDSLI